MGVRMMVAMTLRSSITSNTETSCASCRPATVMPSVAVSQPAIHNPA